MATDGRISYGEYCERERIARIRSEYHHGRTFAMAGGTIDHAAIARNLLLALGPALAGSNCAVYGSDLRIRIDAAGHDTYADLMILCGPPRFTSATRDCVTNPRVLFEVLSPSPERYDRGKKFESYGRLPSLAEYVLIAQDRVRAEVFRRQDQDRWLLMIADGSDASLYLESVGVPIPLAALYQGVAFPPEGDYSNMPSNSAEVR